MHAIELDGWKREDVSVDPSGVALLRYRRTRDDASVVIEVAPPDPASRALVKASFGNLSYRAIVGAEPGDAVALVRRFAERLGGSDVAEFQRFLRDCAPDAPPPVARPQLDPELLPDVFAIRASGYTIVKNAIDKGTVERLAAEAERALARSKQLIEARGPLSHSNLEVYDPRTFVANRALYCWGDALRSLVELPVIERLATAVLGAHRLHEMAVQAALPARGVDRMQTEQWHRDLDLVEGRADLDFLWFMFPIDDFTSQNGATWVVPGSQRDVGAEVPPSSHGLTRFPSRVQLVVDRGDLIVLNPSVLHTWGYNATERDRRMVNVMLCRRELRPVLDHWTLAGPAITETASGRLRELLGEEFAGQGDPKWDALPDGWITTGRRPSAR